MGEKLMLAARAIATIENPEDVFVVSSRPYGQRAVLKFARYIGTSSMAGRYTPGSLTNQIQTAFKEPRLLVVTDPRADHQPITEASYVNIPVVAFCNTDSPVKFIDIAIPCNTKSIYSVGLMWWILAREVLRLRGTISREVPWTVMPDLYFYRDPEEVEKEEQAAQEAKQAPADQMNQYSNDWDTPAIAAAPQEDWNEAPAPAMGGGGFAQPAAAPVSDDRSAPVSNWAGEAAPTAAGGETEN